MAKTTGKYEAVIVLSTKAGEEEVKALVEKFNTLITENSTLNSVDEWGKRKLAYAINYETEGYYVIFSFESEPAFPAELERICGITDGILRSMVINKD